MKKPIEVKKKLKKVTEYTACFAFLMFLQGVGAPMVFADATTAINAKFEILWNLISAVVQSGWQNRSKKNPHTLFIKFHVAFVIPHRMWKD